MGNYQQELAHSYEHKQGLFSFRSGSLFQALTPAAAIGILVAAIGLAINVVWQSRQFTWYSRATVQGTVQFLIVW